MDWNAKEEGQLLIIDADLVDPVDNIVLTVTEVELEQGMTRTVMLLAHRDGSASDAVDYTLQLSSHAVYQLFASMSNNLEELVGMGWIPGRGKGDE
jgi:Mrp family chromosome partitioning ATPase